MSQSLDLPKRASTRTPDVVDPDRMLQASSVAARFDISVRTLDRWLQKPHFGFPQPAMKTKDAAGRVAGRFWRLGDLVKWEQAHSAQ